MPKANSQTEKNQIKISPTALLKTEGREWKMTGQTMQEKSNDCLRHCWSPTNNNT